MNKFQPGAFSNSRHCTPKCLQVLLHPRIVPIYCTIRKNYEVIASTPPPPSPRCLPQGLRFYHVSSIKLGKWPGERGCNKPPKSQIILQVCILIYTRVLIDYLVLDSQDRPESRQIEKYSCCAQFSKKNV